ncbi:unnamed protein product [Parnassius apollo]|uniref:monoamine oxidase n=1 Tax=Parnassius apollo TaxID=110799 RepID=A0A8S3WGZ5_PARAO|nr:unnamed protein product [Parnassius apollo]
MVKKYETDGTQTSNIKADVIVLGCSLPGIVAAHKLKQKFGDTMDVVIIDLAGTNKGMPKFNAVSFSKDEDNTTEECTVKSTHQFLEHFSRRYLVMYAKEFNITIPDEILTPESIPSPLNKLFEYTNGKTVQCTNNFHDFDYLGVFEKFELSQYQRLIDESMKNIFHVTKPVTESERRKLLYYDQTTMEKHICGALLFSTSREIMRTVVRLVCGASPDTVSVLFYLHQCYRNISCKNYVDGNNTKFREKLLGYCWKRLAYKLQQSVAGITLKAKAIKKIRTYSDEQVIVETMKGENNYVCNFLAMAVRPDELTNINVEPTLLPEREAEIARFMLPGRVKKFMIQYETDFWRDDGYSGDILSIRGPIVWAMERPGLSATGSKRRYSSLVGYLKAKMCDGDKQDSKEEVIEQLVKLFGESAANPVNYKESDVEDVFIPRCGDYVALRKWTKEQTPGLLEWGALDIYREGDITGAIEAGHTAYLHVSSCLRPQAQTFEDVSAAEIPISVHGNFCNRVLANINIISSMSLVAYTTAVYVGIRLAKSYLGKQ